RSVSVSGPLLERGWPFGFRFSAFPTLSDLVRTVAGSNLFLIPRRRGLPFGFSDFIRRALVELIRPGLPVSGRLRFAE
ncbi:hypothetical protein, partial [Streptomyces lydicus]|uniref:hypothetical protein n=1 Tax=Streptomyces lydicus TaxID=47763 RepID=UPI00331F5904